MYIFSVLHLLSFKYEMSTQAHVFNSWSLAGGTILGGSEHI